MPVDWSMVGKSPCFACGQFAKPNEMLLLRVEGLMRGLPGFRYRAKAIEELFHPDCIVPGMDRVKEILSTRSGDV